MSGGERRKDNSSIREKGKKMGCPQEGKGHPYKRVSMVTLYITKSVMIVNRKATGFFYKKVTLIFDT
jgi:ribosomal protein S18